jgi:hypothetical protein
MKELETRKRSKTVHSETNSLEETSGQIRLDHTHSQENSETAGAGEIFPLIDAIVRP